MANPWPRTVALRVLAALWSAPVGALGLVLLGLFAVCGWARVLPTAGVLYVVTWGPLARRLWGAGWGGFTLGWTVFLWHADAAGNAEMLRHEAAHVRQVLVWGPAFPVVYLALLASYGYDAHPFEMQARRAAAAEVQP